MNAANTMLIEAALLASIIIRWLYLVFPSQAELDARERDQRK